LYFAWYDRLNIMMRKWLLVPVVLLLAVISIYWFIPSQLTVVQITHVHCPATAAFRSLTHQEAWRKWWPSKDTAGHTLQYGGSQLQVSKTLLNTFEIQIQHAGLTINSTMNLLPLPADSMAIQWKCMIPSGMNPFTRIQRYRQAIAVKNNMAAVSNALRAFDLALSDFHQVDSHFGQELCLSGFVIPC